jgi:periplasmic divalent cation tolerance protein
MTPADPIVVLCAAPEDFDPGELATTLIERSLAACVQVTPGVTSFYVWQGAMETSAEKLLLIKTRFGRFAEVEALIRSCHPYEVPEIIALPVSAGHEPYLSWIASQTA